MVKNHPFVDGNKRLGLATTFVFLLLNHHVLLCSNEEMVAFALNLAGSDPAMRWEEVAAWVELNSSAVLDLQQRSLYDAGLAQLAAAVSAVAELFSAED